MSEFSIWTRAIAESFSGDDQSPSHTPLVRGWSGFAWRAQAKTLGSSTRTVWTLSRDSDGPALESFLLLGSFHRSQANTRGSRPNAPTMPCT